MTTTYQDLIETIAETELPEDVARKWREVLEAHMRTPTHRRQNERSTAYFGLAAALEESIFFSLRGTEHDPETLEEMMDEEYGPKHIVVPATHECYP